jgi:hypothetical protein
MSLEVKNLRRSSVSIAEAEAKSLRLTEIILKAKVL